MAIVIRPVTETQAGAASALVHASFTALAASDWGPSAQRVFLAESAAEALARKLRVATYASAAFNDRQMVGFILMPSPTVLGMLFVHPHWLRQGVARALWESARAHIEDAHPDTKAVELNATPYAVPFYRSVGFVPTSAEFVRDGCRATRMACSLRRSDERGK